MHHKTTFTTSSSYRFSDNLIKATVYVVGSGGTSGVLYPYRISRHKGVNGGGAGGYCKKTYDTELSGKLVSFVVGQSISGESQNGQESSFLGLKASGGNAGVKGNRGSGKGGTAIGGDENYAGKDGVAVGGTWSSGQGKGAEGVELFGTKYGYGGGCGDCRTCSSYKTGYNTVSGGGCVIIEEWVSV